jgi:hypothetical protein
VCSFPQGLGVPKRFRGPKGLRIDIVEKEAYHAGKSCAFAVPPNLYLKRKEKKTI